MVDYMQFTKFLQKSRLYSITRTLNRYDGTFILVFFLAMVTRCYEISLPYSKIYESGFQEIIAKNHYYYGFTQTHFLSVVSVVDGENMYHVSHPPLLQILITLSYTFFGVHEWSARLVPIVFSLGSIILLYIIVQLLFSKEVALFTSIFASFMPMSAYFGRIVNFEAVALFFVLLVVWGYLYWVETDKKIYYFCAVAGTILGGLVDWPFFLIFPFLLGSAFLTGKKIRSTICLFILGCSVAGGFILYRTLIAGSEWGGGNLLSRIIARSDMSYFLLNGNWYVVLTTRLWNNYTIVLVLLSVVGIIYCIRRIDPSKLRMKTVDNRTLIPLSLLLFGLSYVVFFPQAVFLHASDMYYLIPGISIYGGIGLHMMIREIKGHPHVIIGSRILAGTLLILFLVFSTQTLIEYHQGKSQGDLNIGLLINNNSESDEYICVVEYGGPISYYANRTNCQHILSIPNRTAIQKYSPRFVIYFQPKSQDSKWNRSNFTEFLYEQKYIPLSQTGEVIVWAKSVDTLPLLYRKMSSIELYDFSLKKKIEMKNDSNIVFTSINSDGNIVLFEHPSIDGVMMVNYQLTIPSNATLIFGAGLDEKTWAFDKGDGVIFEIYLNASGKRSLVFSQYIDPKTNISDRRWHNFTVPLHEYAGKNVTLGFATSPGAELNTAYDWAFWINPIVTVGE